MKFVEQGNTIEIQGDPSLSKSLISPQALMKVTEIEAVSVVWGLETDLMGGMMKSQLSEMEQSALQEVLQSYGAVFAEPKGLPPRRKVDHKIPIKMEWILSTFDLTGILICKRMKLKNKLEIC